MAALEVVPSRKFKSSRRKLVRSGCFNSERLDRIVMSLAKMEELEKQCYDHALTGNWQGYRECHISGGILLIYKVEFSFITLSYLGTHAQLFGM